MFWVRNVRSSVSIYSFVSAVSHRDTFYVTPVARSTRCPQSFPKCVLSNEHGSRLILLIHKDDLAPPHPSCSVSWSRLSSSLDTSRRAPRPPGLMTSSNCNYPPSQVLSSPSGSPSSSVPGPVPSLSHEMISRTRNLILVTSR